jgi:hypothetical protein
LKARIWTLGLNASRQAIKTFPAQVCANNSVRLALERPVWSPEINYMFPLRFKVRAHNALLNPTYCNSSDERPSAQLAVPVPASVPPSGLALGPCPDLDHHSRLPSFVPLFTTTLNVTMQS